MRLYEVVQEHKLLEKRGEVRQQELYELERLIDDLNSRSVLFTMWETFTHTLRQLDVALTRVRTATKDRSVLLAQDTSGNQHSLLPQLNKIHVRHSDANDTAQLQVGKLISVVRLASELFQTLKINSKVRGEMDFLLDVLESFNKRLKLTKNILTTEDIFLRNQSKEYFATYVGTLKEFAHMEQKGMASVINIDHVRKMKEAYFSIRTSFEEKDFQSALLAARIISVHGFHSLWRNHHNGKRPAGHIVKPYLFASVYMILVFQTIEYLLMHSLSMKRHSSPLLTL